MKKILSIIVGLIFTFTALQAEEKLTIEKQLVGIVGADFLLKNNATLNFEEITLNV